MKARRPSSVSRQSLSRQPGPRCRCFILFCSVLTSTHRGRRGFLFVHVRPADLTGAFHVSPVLRPPSLARKRPRTPASSTTRSQLPDRQGAPRLLFGLSTPRPTRRTALFVRLLLHQQHRRRVLHVSFGNSKTDDAHCASRLSTNKTDSAHCASSSAFSSKVDHVHCTFSSASNQPPLPSIKKGPSFTSTSPTWQRSEDAGAVPEATAAKSKPTGLPHHLPPRPRAVPQRGPRQLTSSTTPSTGKRTSTSSPTTSVIRCAVLC